MFDWLPDKLINEMRDKPYTMVSILALAASVAFLYSDLRELKKDMAGVVYTLEHDHLDSRYHNVEKDLFDIKRAIAVEEKKPIDVPQIYIDRERDLEQQHEDIRRQMDILERVKR